MNIENINGQLLRNYQFLKSNHLKQSKDIKNYNNIRSSKEKTVDSKVDNNYYLKLGNTSDEISQLQTLLKNLGHFNGCINGYYGKRTKDAVINFQKYCGLKETGEIDSTTKVAIAKSRDRAKVPQYSTKAMLMKRLKRNVAINQDFMVYAGYESGIADSTNRFQGNYIIPKDHRMGDETLRRINIIYNRMKLQENWATKPDGLILVKDRNKSKQLEIHQEKLKRLGFYKATIDGKYGYCTYTAVCAFQASKQLVQDGILGPQTINALKQAC